MNKEIVNKIIKDIIVEKVVQMISDTSTNEFVEMVCDEIYKQTGESIEDDSEVKDMIGDVMIPLYHKLSLFIVENSLTK